MKAKPLITCRKLMCTVFWDRSVRFAFTFLGTWTNSQHGTLIEKDSENRFAQYRISLVSCFEAEFCSFMTMPEHTLHVTRNNALQSYDKNFSTTPPTERISHQMNFPLFKDLKSFLADKKFRDDDEIRSIVTEWLQSQVASLFDEVIHTIVPCYDKHLNNGCT
ncbi:hypothetical protein TNIN_455521 [Trichonephila inaurata madagascariensis]|uniref:Uncharacterized protein n=1 Tax=Trichonephila inaurata madagascariensis TaxID=2747483 RepID=A0A8X6YFL9_9ARAC|nr:hypothetical protein TNIN_455521 [Trichonephila inaurata madagascariensis]